MILIGSDFIKYFVILRTVKVNKDIRALLKLY